MSGKEWTKETFPEWEKERFLAKTRPKLKSVICCESVVRKKVSDVVRKCDFERERDKERERNIEESEMREPRLRLVGNV